MKDNLKIIISSVIISVVAFSLMGCSKNISYISTETNTVKAQNKEVSDIKEYSKELSSYFPINEMAELHYSGTLEYGETVKLNKITGTKKSLTLQFKGEVKNESDKEGPDKDKFQFEKEYTIDNESVKEVQKNGEMKKKNAAIEKATILKLPIKKGNAWEEEVEFKGSKYKAKTTIIDVTKNKDNKNLVKTETIINGIKGYPQNAYKEVKVYEEGKGLVEFSNTILTKGSEKEAYPIEFRYHEF